MKKINFTPKAKKITVITGAAVLCLGVLSAVLLQNNAHSQISAALVNSESSAATSAAVPDISPAQIRTTDTVPSSAPQTGTGSAFDPSKEESRSEPLTVVSKPTSQPPKPVIEGDSKDGKQPTNPALTDKKKTPKYKTKPKAPASSPSTKPNNSKNTSSKSSGGSSDNENHAGKIYVDGFGWISKPQGDGEYKTVGNSGDQLTGDKVGIMD